MRVPTLHLVALMLLGVLVVLTAAAQANQRLYLKDGTYELVRTYEVRGDRVRYYSVERSAWEEVPKSLVDFAATERARRQESASNQKQIEQAKKLERELHVNAPATGYEVAPGQRLPGVEGVFAFDGLRVAPLIQSSGKIVTDKERRALNLALPAPLLKRRSLVVLPGARAAVRFSNPQPTFYIQAADGWGARAVLVPLKAGKNSRLIEKVQAGFGVGRTGEWRTALAVERSTVAPGLIRLRPLQPLSPGEYALGELISGKLNLDVWDFGINRPE